MNESVRVEVAPPDAVAQLWSRVLPGIAKGCEHSYGLYSPESLYEAATATPPRAYVIVAFTPGDEDKPAELIASGVAVISVFPTGRKVIEMLVVGGAERGRWIELLDAKLTEWARAEGASYVIFSGRKGWAKAGLPEGWRPMAMTFGKEITPEPEPVEARESEVAA